MWLNQKIFTSLSLSSIFHILISLIPKWDLKKNEKKFALKCKLCPFVPLLKTVCFVCVHVCNLLLFINASLLCGVVIIIIIIFKEHYQQQYGTRHIHNTYSKNKKKKKQIHAAKTQLMRSACVCFFFAVLGSPICCCPC